jgi:hypothetical protein
MRYIRICVRLRDDPSVPRNSIRPHFTPAVQARIVLINVDHTPFDHWNVLSQLLPEHALTFRRAAVCGGC